jgi:AraC-like DNA-binding protein
MLGSSSARELYEQTASLDDLLAALHQVAPDVRISVNQPKYFRWRARFLSTPHFHVWRSQTNADWTCDAGPLTSRLFVALPSSGTLEVRSRNEELEVNKDYALVVTDPERLAFSGHGSPSLISLKWEASAVRDVLSHIYGQHGESHAALGPRLDLRSNEGQLLHFMAQGLAEGHLHDIGGSPSASALVSETMLRLIVGSRCPDPDISFGRSPVATGSRQVRAAIDLMYERLHEPLTLSTLAASLGVSGRSLQQGFRRFHDTTPLAFLRNLRLEAVHRELSNPRNVLSVGEIASKWGFAHVGRLAKLYRSTYGRAPSETVRRVARRR